MVTKFRFCCMLRVGVRVAPKCRFLPATDKKCWDQNRFCLFFVVLGIEF